LLIFMHTTKGNLVQTTAEAHVVPNMTVNILLGEDYQLNYGININQTPGLSPSLSFANQDTAVPADPIGPCLDLRRVKQSVMSTQLFVKQASHRRMKSYWQRTQPSIVQLPVTGSFGDNPSKEWFVDWGFVKWDKSNMLATDPSIFLASLPVISVFNAAHATRYINKGDLLGYLEEPKTYFDTPRMVKEAEMVLSHFEKTTALVRSCLDAEDAANTVQADTEAKAAATSQDNINRADKPLEPVIEEGRVQSKSCRSAQQYNLQLETHARNPGCEPTGTRGTDGSCVGHAPEEHCGVWVQLQAWSAQLEDLYPHRSRAEAYFSANVRSLT
jgi:hypothetical protein